VHQSIETISLVALLLVQQLQPSCAQAADHGDHPVYQQSTCPGRLWQPDEVPRLHEINLIMEPADFRWQIDHQDEMSGTAALRDMNLTTIVFDGETFDGGHFKVHGGKYQRGGESTSASRPAVLGASCRSVK
jgi:hypothetical protein